MDKRYLVLLLTLFFAACQVSPTPSATPTELEVVLVTPALLPQAAEWAQNFQEDRGQILLNLNPMPFPAAVEALENGEAGVVITSQDPPLNWWAIPLGSEPIAVVVHSSNPVQELTHSELIQIFSGQATDWEPWTGQSQSIEVVFPLPGDDIRTRFIDLLSPGVRLVPGARLASNPTALAEAVAQSPGRIGILPYSLMDETLAALQIDGAYPEDEGYAFSLDIIATAPEEPEGSIQAWLLWLQERNLDFQALPTETIGPTITDETPVPSASGNPIGSTTAPPTRTPSVSQTP